MDVAVVGAATALVAWATTGAFQGFSDQEEDTNTSRQQDLVRKDYANTITGARKVGCCESTESSLAMGYTMEDLKLKGDNVQLGCGNPVALADIQPGEIVMDLGCGAGHDCILAASKVGENGKVIGVDMTPEMLKEARATTEKKNLAGTVSYRLGEIEYLPAANASVNAIISNCVINLSPDKLQVFRECFRCLKEGGRIAIADVIAKGDIPERLKTAEALSC